MLIRNLSRLFAVGLLALGASGCGLLFVEGPLPAPEQAAMVGCDDSRLLPSLDLLWAALNAARTIVIATDRSAYSPAIAVGSASVVVWGYSAYVGYGKVSDCRAAQDLRAALNNQNDGADAGLALLPTSVTELFRGPLPVR